jgi:TolB-like protein/Tfp pilus assembly protein PilF
MGSGPLIRNYLVLQYAGMYTGLITRTDLMQDGEQTDSLWRFGTFELNSRTGELRKKGIKIKLQDQPLQVLIMLLNRPGEIVSREELQKKLWPADTFVDFEHGLNKAMNRLRAALGDSSENPRFIETLARKGYRFIASPVNANLPASAMAESPKIRLAVLPLENLNCDPEQEFFSDGLTEELITRLGGLSAGKLGVIARTSVNQYKRTLKPIDEIGRELNVDYIVEGSVRRSNGRVRISAQLIQVSDQTHVWAESYERELQDVLALQDDVAGAVVAEIRNRIAPEIRMFPVKTQIINPNAYESYLKGCHYFGKLSREGFWKAMECFKAAIDAEKNYAPAYSGLADCCWKLGQLGLLRPMEAYPNAKQAAQRAIEIDPLLADAHVSLASVAFYYEWDWAGAEKEFLRAIQLNPGLAFAHASYALSLVFLGRHSEASIEVRKALELEPLGQAPNLIFALYLHFSGQIEAAVEQYRKMIDLYPDCFHAYTTMALALYQCSRFDECIESAHKAAELSGVSYPLTLAGIAYASSGRRKQAVAVLERLDLEARQSYVPAVYSAMLALRLGRLVQAYELFESAFNERDSGLVTLKSLPLLGFVKLIPGVGKYVRRLNFPSEIILRHQTGMKY